MRAARNRALALATLPFLLLLLAGITRLWSPDFAPYGPADAHMLAAVRGATWTTNPALALLRPIVVNLPRSVEALVVVRGLLDVATIGVAFLAARTLLGLWPALLAASLYLVSPWAWLAARNVGVTAAPLLAAVALTLAVRYQRSPRLWTGLLLGLVVGLLVRADPAGWAFVPALFAAVALARAPWKSEAGVLLGALVGGGSALLSTLGALRPTTVALLDRPAAALHLAAGTGLGSAADGWLALPAWLDPMTYAALGLVGLLLALAVVAAVQRFREGERGPLVALAWAALPLVALALVDRPPAATVSAGGAGSAISVVPGAVSAATGLPLPESAALLALLPGIVVLLALAVSVAPLATWGPGLVRLLDRMPPAAARIASNAPRGTAWLGVTLLAGVSAVTLAGLMYGSVAAAENRMDGPFIARDGTAPLRYWQGVANAVEDAAARTGSQELVLLASPDGMLTGARARMLLAGLLGPNLAIRDLPSGQIALPLDRETVYLTLPGAERPRILAWPSARLAVIPTPGSDPSADVARVVTLRPRPAVDWLAGATATPEIAFADGSFLAGVQIHPDGAGLDLIWQRQPASETGEAGEAAPVRPSSPDQTGAPTKVDVAWQTEGQPARPAAASLPPRASLRPGELLVQRVTFAPPTLDQRGATLTVRLVPPSGQPIPTADGAPEATVTLSLTR